MTRNEALKHPYIVRLRELLKFDEGVNKANILRQIELKVELLTGEISQEEYNNELFKNLECAMNANNFGV